MGIQERREREKNERRKTILDSARDLILEHGAQNVSMEEIARKAELSKATIYLYFSGKEIIFNEICENSARVFLDHIEPYLKKSAIGIDMLKSIWRGFMELFGNSDEMIIVFKVRNFLNPGQPFVSLEEYGKSDNVKAILEKLTSIIEQCKKEGTFDPNLDSQMATRVLLSLFSNFIDIVSNVPKKEQSDNASFFDEMLKTFQVILYGFGKENIDRSCLTIA